MKAVSFHNLTGHIVAAIEVGKPAVVLEMSPSYSLDVQRQRSHCLEQPVYICGFGKPLNPYLGLSIRV